MDIFMKNKLTTLLIVLLLLLNFFTIGTIWFGHFNKPDKRPPAPGPGKSDNGFHFMAREMELSEEQKQYFKEIRKEHFKKTRILNDNMRDIKRKISEELFKNVVDTVKVNSLLAEFGETQEAFEREIFDHFLTLKKACNSDQKEKLRELMHEIFHIDKRDMEGIHREPPPMKQREDRKKPPRDRRPPRDSNRPPQDNNDPPPPRQD